MDKIVVTTSAKINIGLWVFGVRADGFHNIQSIFFPVNESNSNLLGDRIEISEGCFCGAGKVRILTSGITIGGDPIHNSCVKAYNLLDEKFNLPPVNIHLEKNVPIGAGLGGGSADGVYTLKALSQLFKLFLSDADLIDFAARLGSDCPFFVNPQPALVEGRGEIITPLCEMRGESVNEQKGESTTERIAEEKRKKAAEVLKELNDNYRIEIIPSSIFISTPHAYSIVGEREGYTEYTSGDASVAGASQSSLLEQLSQPISQWQNTIVNDFEEAIFKEYPQLRKTKEELLERGAVYASMTGSGSAVYGIFFHSGR